MYPTLLRVRSDNAIGADNQQGSPVVKQDPSETTRRGSLNTSKIWSVLHGDMQRPAEMTGPLWNKSTVHSGLCNKEA